MKNRTIFIRDNLEVMRGIADECIDLIYLDPPFNSNHDYAAPIGSQAAGAEFKDTWGLSDIDLAWHGEIESQYPGLYKLLETTREIHGKSMMSYLIYIAIRIMEMKRILKPTGSIYLHCDPTASHYLKLLMDEVFGRKFFRDEIVWRRNESGAKGSQHASKRWGNNVDHLLFYTKGKNFQFDPRIIKNLTESEINNMFPKIDEYGNRYNTKTTAWRSPSMGDRPNLCYEFRGHYPPYSTGWRMKYEKMEEEYQKGNIVVTEEGLERRSYMKYYAGVSPGNLWVETELLLGARSKERTGYPTQKPLKLLERIIKASSNEGDMILDPFCGCATTCVAAEKLDRKWVGIDISPKAAELVKSRMQNELGFTILKLIHRTDIPTDRGGKRSRDIKNILYGKQEGMCSGCGHWYRIKDFEVDHIVPKSKGGSDTDENLQLLCGYCNRIKGDRTQEYLISQVRK